MSDRYNGFFYCVPFTSQEQTIDDENRQEVEMVRYWIVPILTVSLMASSSQAGAQDISKRDDVWAQSYTDVPADPAIRFGQLPNGLRYAVMHNATPAHHMSLRLYIGSGSLAETDDQQGLAHFLEHMAFRGSKHIPDGEMIRILERHGLAFGADTNASTSQTATIYQFDFPTADEESAGTGLLLLRDIASELTLSQASMDAERGVILSEERLRDNPAFRAAKAQVGFDLESQRAPERWPIGKIDVIERAPVSRVRDFYRAHYRPDNAVVIAVGDFDAAAMEQRIKKQFADWRPSGPAVAKPDLGKVEMRGRQVRTFVDPGAANVTHIAWARPYDGRADTVAKERSDYVRLLASEMMNQRLIDLANGPNPPYLGAQLGQADLLLSASLTDLSIAPKPRALAEALRVVIDEQRRALLLGFSEAELDRARTGADAMFRTAAEEGGTRVNAKIVANLIHNVEADGVATSPAQDYAYVRLWAPTVTIAEANAALRGAFVGSGPLVFVSGPTAPIGGVDAVTKALDEAGTDTLTAGPAAVASKWPYTSFGPAGSVAGRKEIKDLGVTEVTFANGVRLTVKPTPFVQGEVLVAVTFGDGRLGLPLADARSFWAVNGLAPVFVEGGTGKLGYTALRQALTGCTVSLSQGIEDDVFSLKGRTTIGDLATQMQLMTAYVSDPGYRPETFERFRTLTAGALQQSVATPGAVLGRYAAKLLHGGDDRWSTIPPATALADAQPGDVRTILQPGLSGPLDVTIVGSVDVDTAIAATAATFGTLTPRGAARPVNATVNLLSPSPDVMRLHDEGRADQALALDVWAGPSLLSNASEARTLAVAAAIIQTRLTDRLRSAEGTTYSPVVQASASDVERDYGFLLGLVEVPPTKTDTFHTELAEIIADLAAHPVNDDELRRAKEPIIQTRRREQQDNATWLAVLSGIQRDPERVSLIRTVVTGIQEVTATDVQRAVAAKLNKPSSLRVVISAAPQ